MPSTKLRDKNKAKRSALIKSKYGNDTLETGLNTTTYGSEFSAPDFANGKTKMDLTIDPCPPGEYVIEWYVKCEEVADKPIGKLTHNGNQKKQEKVKKNVDANNFFVGLEEITIIEEIITTEEIIDGVTNIIEKIKPQVFEVELDKVDGGKSKISNGAIEVYRKETYVPLTVKLSPSIYPVNYQD